MTAFLKNCDGKLTYVASTKLQCNMPSTTNSMSLSVRCFVKQTTPTSNIRYYTESTYFESNIHIHS